VIAIARVVSMDAGAYDGASVRPVPDDDDLLDEAVTAIAAFLASAPMQSGAMELVGGSNPAAAADDGLRGL